MSLGGGGETWPNVCCTVNAREPSFHLQVAENSVPPPVCPAAIHFNDPCPLAFDSPLVRNEYLNLSRPPSNSSSFVCMVRTTEH